MRQYPKSSTPVIRGTTKTNIAPKTAARTDPNTSVPMSRDKLLVVRSEFDELSGHSIIAGVFIERPQGVYAAGEQSSGGDNGSATFASATTKYCRVTKGSAKPAVAK